MEKNECICSKIVVDGINMGANLNYDCPKHGINSDWYNSKRQVNKRAKQTQHLIHQQALAREARKNVR